MAAGLDECFKDDLTGTEIILETKRSDRQVLKCVKQKVTTRHFITTT